MRVKIGAPVAVVVAVVLCVGVGLWQRPATVPAPPARLVVHRVSRPVPPPFTFPAGGRTLTGAYRFVALYGSPNEPVLGALGQQTLPESVNRVRQLADVYRPLSTQPIYPTFEVISTVASATPTDNGDYSREVDTALLQTWVTAAQQAGIYVVLDLQPGRSDFLTQAIAYEPLLRQPNVGLALDPEWRLQPTQLPLEQIGSVAAPEVNSVVTWLAALVDAYKLPQKLLVLHQFRLDMLPNRASIDTARPELAYIIQMDGQGSQPAKQGTWQAITATPPPNTEFGWKNFYAKDTPMLDPAPTMQIAPTPWYISYQ